jgi:Zn-dependent protease with chaperone function
VTTLETYSFIDQFWFYVGNLIFYITSYEQTLGTRTVGTGIAAFFTLTVLISKIINVRLSGGKWGLSTAQGLISASWVFPMLYLPYQGTPYWIALLFGIIMWFGSWLLLRKIATNRYPYSKIHKH